MWFCELWSKVLQETQPAPAVARGTASHPLRGPIHSDTEPLSKGSIVERLAVNNRLVLISAFVPKTYVLWFCRLSKPGYSDPTHESLVVPTTIMIR